MSLYANFAERFESGARKALPYSLMAVLLFLNSVSVPLVAAADIKAPLFLMGLYYWSIYRPTLIRPWMAFIAGMASDLLGGLPLGLNASVYLLAQWVVTDQRRFLMGQSFVMIWFGFFILSLFTSFLQWLVFGFVNFLWPFPKSLGFSILFGMALFPLVSMALQWTHRILPAPARALEPH